MEYNSGSPIYLQAVFPPGNAGSSTPGNPPASPPDRAASG